MPYNLKPLVVAIVDSPEALDEAHQSARKLKEDGGAVDGHRIPRTSGCAHVRMQTPSCGLSPANQGDEVEFVNYYCL